MINGRKIGLALSGGGYRAAAFHLGTLKKLNELGILKDVDVFSCVSGGAITGTYYCLNQELPFEKIEENLKNILQKSVTNRVLFSLETIAIILCFITLIGLFFWLDYSGILVVSAPFILILIYLFFKFQFGIYPISRIIERKYTALFFGSKKLSHLNKNPILAINATNIESGRQWTFSQNKMGDSYYAFPQEGDKILFRHEDFPISRAVASSTCVPFAFTPVKIAKKYFQNPNQFNRIEPRLIDGGVYDNQGIHKLTQKGSSYLCDTVIVSDAGLYFVPTLKYNNNFTLLMRTSDIFMRRIKNFQFQKNIYYRDLKDKKEITYFSLSWRIDSCIKGFINNLKNGNISDEIIIAHKIEGDLQKEDFKTIEDKIKNNIEYHKILEYKPSTEEIEMANKVKTNLASLTINEINALVNHAASLTEVQIKLYFPSIIQK